MAKIIEDKALGLEFVSDDPLKSYNPSLTIKPTGDFDIPGIGKVSKEAFAPVNLWESDPTRQAAVGQYLQGFDIADKYLSRENITPEDLDDINEVMYRNQSTVEAVANGFVSRAISILPKTLNVIGSIGGLGYGMMDYMFDAINPNEEADLGRSLNQGLDNFWVRGMNHWDESLKELMPVFGSKYGYYSDSLMDNLSSAKFWGEDLFDGVAFTVSAFVPGAGWAKALDVMSKTAKGANFFAQTAKFAKYGKAAQAMNAMSKEQLVASGVDKLTNILTTATNVINESALEAYEATKNFDKDTFIAKKLQESPEAKRIMQLEEQVSMMRDDSEIAGLINPEEGPKAMKMRELQEAKDNLLNQLDEEYLEAKGQLGLNVFRANNLVLVLPDYLQSKLFTKAFGNASKSIRAEARQTANKAIRTSSLKEGFKQAGYAVGREGFWEENAQTASSTYYQEKAFGSPRIDNDVVGILDNMVQNATFQDKEGAKSIILGAAAGGLSSFGLGAYAQREKNKEFDKETKLWQNILTIAGASIKTAVDDWRGLADENGNISTDNFIKAFTFAKDKKASIESQQVALLLGNEIAHELGRNDEITKLFWGEVSSVNGSKYTSQEEAIEVVKSKLTALKEAEGADKETIAMADGFVAKVDRLSENLKKAEETIDKVIDSENANAVDNKGILTRSLFFAMNKLAEVNDLIDNAETISDKQRESLGALATEYQEAIDALSDRTQVKGLVQKFTDDANYHLALQNQIAEETAKPKETQDPTKLKVLKYQLEEFYEIYGFQTAADKKSRRAWGNNSLRIGFAPTDVVNRGTLGLRDKYFYDLGRDALVHNEAERLMADESGDVTAAEIVSFVESDALHYLTKAEADKFAAIADSKVEALNEAKSNSIVVGEDYSVDYTAFNELSKSPDNIFTEKNSSKPSELINSAVAKKSQERSEFIGSEDKEMSFANNIRRRLATKFKRDTDIMIEKINEDIDSYSNIEAIDARINDTQDRIDVFEQSEDHKDLFKGDSAKFIESLKEQKAVLEQLKGAAINNKGNKEALDTKLKNIENQSMMSAFGLTLDGNKVKISNMVLIDKIKAIVGVDALNKLISNLETDGMVGDYVFMDKFMYDLTEDQRTQISEAIKAEHAIVKDRLSKSVFRPKVADGRLDQYAAILENPQKILTVFLGSKKKFKKGEDGYIFLLSTTNKKNIIDRYMTHGNLDLLLEEITIDNGKTLMSENVKLTAQDVADTVEFLKDMIQMRNNARILSDLASTSDMSKFAKAEKDLLTSTTIGPSQQQRSTIKRMYKWLGDFSSTKNSGFSDMIITNGIAGTGKTMVVAKMLFKILAKTNGISVNKNVVVLGATKEVADNLSNSIGKTIGATSKAVEDLKEEDLNDNISIIAVDEIGVPDIVRLGELSIKLRNVNAKRIERGLKPIKLIGFGDPNQVTEVKGDNASRITELEGKVDGVQTTDLIDIKFAPTLLVQYRSDVDAINEAADEFSGRKKPVKNISAVSNVKNDDYEAKDAKGVHAYDNINSFIQRIEGFLKANENKTITLAYNTPENKDEIYKRLSDEARKRVVFKNFFELQGLTIDNLFINVKVEGIDQKRFNSSMYMLLSRATNYVAINDNHRNFTQKVDPVSIGKVADRNIEQKVKNKDAYDKVVEEELAVMGDVVVVKKPTPKKPAKPSVQPTKADEPELNPVNHQPADPIEEEIDDTDDREITAEEKAELAAKEAERVKTKSDDAKVGDIIEDTWEPGQVKIENPSGANFKAADLKDGDKLFVLKMTPSEVKDRPKEVAILVKEIEVAGEKKYIEVAWLNREEVKALGLEGHPLFKSKKGVDRSKDNDMYSDVEHAMFKDESGNLIQVNVDAARGFKVKYDPNIKATGNIISDTAGYVANKFKILTGKLNVEYFLPTRSTMDKTNPKNIYSSLPLDLGVPYLIVTLPNGKTIHVRLNPKPFTKDNSWTINGVSAFERLELFTEGSKTIIKWLEENSIATAIGSSSYRDLLHAIGSSKELMLAVDNDKKFKLAENISATTFEGASSNRVDAEKMSMFFGGNIDLFNSFIAENKTALENVLNQYFSVKEETEIINITDSVKNGDPYKLGGAFEAFADVVNDKFASMLSGPLGAELAKNNPSKETILEIFGIELELTKDNVPSESETNKSLTAAADEFAKEFKKLHGVRITKERLVEIANEAWIAFEEGRMFPGGSSKKISKNGSDINAFRIIRNIYKQMLVFSPIEHTDENGITYKWHAEFDNRRVDGKHVITRAYPGEEDRPFIVQGRTTQNSPIQAILNNVARSNKTINGKNLRKYAPKKRVLVTHYESDAVTLLWESRVDKTTVDHPVVEGMHLDARAHGVDEEAFKMYMSIRDAAIAEYNKTKGYTSNKDHTEEDRVDIQSVLEASIEQELIDRLIKNEANTNWAMDDLDAILSGSTRRQIVSNEIRDANKNGLAAMREYQENFSSDFAGIQESTLIIKRDVPAAKPEQAPAESASATQEDVDTTPEEEVEAGVGLLDIGGSLSDLGMPEDDFDSFDMAEQVEESPVIIKENSLKKDPEAKPTREEVTPENFEKNNTIVKYAMAIVGGKLHGIKTAPDKESIYAITSDGKIGVYSANSRQIMRNPAKAGGSKVSKIGSGESIYVDFIPGRVDSDGVVLEQPKIRLLSDSREAFLVKEGTSQEQLGRVINVNTALAYLRRLFPNTDINTFRFLESVRGQGKDVFGRFIDGIIEVEKIAKSDNLYENIVRHEAFHKVWREFMTASDRKIVVEAYLKTLPKEEQARYSNMSYAYLSMELEEHIARAYQVYNKNQDIKPGPMRKAMLFLKRIFRDLVYLLTGNPAELNHYFNLIDYGFFNTQFDQFRGSKGYYGIIKDFQSVDNYIYAKEFVAETYKYFLFNGRGASKIPMSQQEINAAVILVAQDRLNKRRAFLNANAQKYMDKELTKEQVEKYEQAEKESKAYEMLLLSDKVLRDTEKLNDYKKILDDETIDKESKEYKEAKEAYDKTVARINKAKGQDFPRFSKILDEILPGRADNKLATGVLNTGEQAEDTDLDYEDEEEFKDPSADSGVTALSPFEANSDKHDRETKMFASVKHALSTARNLRYNTFIENGLAFRMVFKWFEGLNNDSDEILLQVRNRMINDVFKGDHKITDTELIRDYGNREDVSMYFALKEIHDIASSNFYGKRYYDANPELKGSRLEDNITAILDSKGDVAYLAVHKKGKNISKALLQDLKNNADVILVSAKDLKLDKNNKHVLMVEKLISEAAENGVTLKDYEVSAVMQKEIFRNTWVEIQNTFSSMKESNLIVVKRKDSFKGIEYSVVSGASTEKQQLVINNIKDEIAKKFKTKPDFIAWIKTQATTFDLKSADIDAMTDDQLKETITAFFKSIGITTKPDFKNTTRVIWDSVVRELNWFSSANMVKWAESQEAKAADKIADENDAIAGRKGEEDADYIDEVFEEEGTILNKLASVISSENTKKRAGSFRGADDKKRYTIVMSEFATKVITQLKSHEFGVRGGGIKLPDYLKTDFMRANPILAGLQKIHKFHLHGGNKYSNNYSEDKVVDYNKEGFQQYMERSFMAYFMRGFKKGGKAVEYFQPVYVKSNRKDTTPAKMNVLTSEKIIDTIYPQIFNQQLLQDPDLGDEWNVDDEGTPVDVFKFVNMGPLKQAIMDATDNKFTKEKFVEMMRQGKTWNDLDAVFGESTIKKTKENLNKYFDGIAKQLAQRMVTDGVKLHVDMAQMVENLLVFDGMDPKVAKETVEKEFKDFGTNLFQSASANAKKDGKGIYSNKASMLEAAVRLFAMNNEVNSYALNQIFTGNQNVFGKGVSILKRMSVIFGPGMGIATGPMGAKVKSNVLVLKDPTYGSEYRKLIYGQVGLTESEINELLSKNSRGAINYADGQGYITPKRAQELRRAVGASYNLSTVGKPLWYDIDENGVAHAIKYSWIELTDEIVSSDSTGGLKALRDLMEKHDVDEAVFASAVKVGLPKGVIDWDSIMNGKVEDADVSKAMLQMKNANYRLQLNPEHGFGDNNTTVPSQLMFILNILNNNVEEADKAYDALMNLYKIGFKELSEKIKKHGKLSEEKVLDTLKTKFKSSPSAEIESNLLDEGVTTDWPAITNKAFSQMTSLFSKNTINQRLKGGKTVLMASNGVTINGRELSYSIEVDADGRKTIMSEAVLTREAAKQILTSEEYKELNDAIAKGRTPNLIFTNGNLFGYRIPSSELHSGVALKIVGLIDGPGVNIVVPKYIVEVHGSDFDVDSLFVIGREVLRDKEGYMLNYTENEKTGLLELWELEEDEINELSTKDKKRYYKNIITEMLLNAISKKENFVRANSAISLASLEGLRVKIARETGGSVVKTEKNLSNVLEAFEVHQSSHNGSDGVGIFASSFKAIAYAMRAGLNKAIPRVTINDNDDRQKLVFNGKLIDLLSNKISTFEMIDALVNAAVDNVKEQILPYFNLNANTMSSFVGMLALDSGETNGISNSNELAGRMARQLFFKNIADYKSGNSFMTTAGVINDIAEALKKLGKDIPESYEDLTTEELTKALSFNEKAGINSLNELFEKLKGTSDAELIDFAAQQVKFFEFYKSFNKVGEDLSKLSGLMSILREFPSDAIALETKVKDFGAVFEEIHDKAAKPIDEDLERKIEYSNVKSKDSFSIDLQELFVTAPHLAEAHKVLTELYLTTEFYFFKHSKEVKRFVEQVSGITGKILNETSNDEVAEEDKEEGQSKSSMKQDVKTKVSMRDDVIKFLINAINWDPAFPGYNNLPPAEIEVNKEKRTVAGVDAFKKHFGEKIYALKEHLKTVSSEQGVNKKILTNKFIDELSPRVSWGGITEWSMPRSVDFKSEDLIRLKADFEKLNKYDIKYNEATKKWEVTETDDLSYKEWQKDFVRYGTIVNGMSFGASSFSLALPSDLYMGLSDGLRAMVEVIKDNPKILYNNKNRFFIQYAFNNILKVKSIDTKAEKEGASYSGFVEIQGKEHFFNLKFPLEVTKDKDNNEIVHENMPSLIRRTGNKISDIFMLVGTKDKHAYYIRLGAQRPTMTYNTTEEEFMAAASTEFKDNKDTIMSLNEFKGMSEDVVQTVWATLNEQVRAERLFSVKVDTTLPHIIVPNTLEDKFKVQSDLVEMLAKKYGSESFMAIVRNQSDITISNPRVVMLKKRSSDSLAVVGTKEDVIDSTSWEAVKDNETIKSSGWTKEDWDAKSQEEKDQFIKCYV